MAAIVYPLAGAAIMAAWALAIAGAIYGPDALHAIRRRIGR